MSNFLNTNVKNSPSFQGIPFNKPVEKNKKDLEFKTQKVAAPFFAQANQPENKAEEPRIEKYLTLYNVNFSLSDEMIDNLSGSRGADHLISQDTLRKALNKKTNTIKKLEQNPDFKKNTRFDWYFRMESNKIYNLVVQGDSYLNRYVVLTGYKMPESVAKQRHRQIYGASNYEAWVKNLPSL